MLAHSEARPAKHVGLAHPVLRRRPVEAPDLVAVPEHGARVLRGGHCPFAVERELGEAARVEAPVHRRAGERQALPAVGIVDQCQVVAGQRLALDDGAQLEPETAQRRQAAGLQMQVREIEAPAVRLPAAMLAHEPVKPAVLFAAPFHTTEPVPSVVSPVELPAL